MNSSGLSPQLKKETKLQIQQMKDLANQMENVKTSKVMKNHIIHQMGKDMDPFTKMVISNLNESYEDYEEEGISEIFDFEFLD